MRKLFIVLATVAVTAPHPARAAAQCGFYSTDPSCANASKPGLTLDFWARAKPKPKASTVAKSAPTPAVPAATARGALAMPTDCRMVMHPPNPNLDTKIVRTPPPNVRFLLRTIPVPPCPDR